MLARPRLLAWCSAFALPPPLKAPVWLWAPELWGDCDRVAVLGAGEGAEYPRSPPRFMLGGAELRAIVLLFAAPARFVVPKLFAVLGRSTSRLLARLTALEF